jgi:hypothetical protein
MRMALPKDIPTLEQAWTKHWTWPDNVFVSDTLLGNIIKCNVAPVRCPPKADHLPILCVIDFPPPHALW